MQFVTGLLHSPKTEGKGVVLVKGLWYETTSSPRLPFNLNQSLSFPGLFQLNGPYRCLGHPYSDIDFLFGLFVGMCRRGRLVSWVEKASLVRIRRLLEITMRGRIHKLLFPVKNL